MSMHRKGAAVTFVVALLFIALELAFDIQTAMAGVFVAGVAGGLLIGDQMTERQAAP